MDVVGRPEIAQREWCSSARERVRHADRLDAIVGEWIAAHAFDRVMATFEEAGAAIAPIYDMEQLANDPHVQATQLITTVADDDLGPLKMQNLSFRMLGTPGRIRFTGRGLGQDTDEIYGERLGLDADRVAELRAEGVI
jgi:crotonobetainyl-CoA:carnitine CoA-transferase CaiB-like acyl-CoA transferase